MIIEADDPVLILSKDTDVVIKAIPSSFSDEWIVVTEDEYGEISIESMTKTQIENEYGEISEDEL